ncbi:MAG: ArsR/SmtB family transcription factor [Candidatus Nanohaloarchaea archaeon]
MDLDFKTVRALSSPTRIRILDRVLDKESTPTSLAEELDRSKSTISSHLDTLLEAELVEKDAEEGRRRVVYTPTGKARDIVEGRERKVKFSLTSSIVSGLAGIALLGYSRLGFMSRASADSVELQAQTESMSTMVTEGGAKAAAETASGGAIDPATAVLAASIFFLGVSVSGLVYGLVMSRLG